MDNCKKVFEEWYSEEIKKGTVHLDWEDVWNQAWNKALSYKHRESITPPCKDPECPLTYMKPHYHNPYVSPYLSTQNRVPPGINDDPMAAEREAYLKEITTKPSETS